jgi:hypothetical protein
MTIKAGTCSACARAVAQNVMRFSDEAYKWTVDPDGRVMHWARPGLDGLYKDGYVAREFNTACGAKVLHVTPG